MSQYKRMKPNKVLTIGIIIAMILEFMLFIPINAYAEAGSEENNEGPQEVVQEEQPQQQEEQPQQQEEQPQQQEEQPQQQEQSQQQEEHPQQQEEQPQQQEEQPQQQEAPQQEAPQQEAQQPEVQQQEEPQQEEQPQQQEEQPQQQDSSCDQSSYSGGAVSKTRTVEIQIGDHIITVEGELPQGIQLQAAEIPKNIADEMAGNETLFSYDIRLVDEDGNVWQPEDHGKDVTVSVGNAADADNKIKINILHFKTGVVDDEGKLSEEALAAALKNLANGGVAKENLGTNEDLSNLTFNTTSFSAFAAVLQRSLYTYEASRDPNHVGVFVTGALTPNSGYTPTNAPTIGATSIADQTLADQPTEESPAIIQGAAVGYEERLGPLEYKELKERDKPYSEYKYQIVDVVDANGNPVLDANGNVQKKLTGFDKTYVIYRLDVSEFYNNSSITGGVLHVKQEQNLCLVPGMGMQKVGESTVDNQFTDGFGARTGSYRIQDLLDQAGANGTPYVDILLYSTGKLAGGADVGKQDAPDGDVRVSMYVDDTVDYNPTLTYDPQSTDPNHQTSCLGKFFNDNASSISRYLVKGSDLALEVEVEGAGVTSPEKDTFWSLEKALENPYYDQAIDSDPNDPNCGRTVKLISEVPVTSEMTLKGSDPNNLKKRTLDVNSFDIQVAKNTSSGQSDYTSGFTMENAWLTIEDLSNTTGAEMAIGNNAKFVIGNAAKLIIHETCQLEVEWDGATVSPNADGTMPANPDILNNGQLDLQAGGEIVNNGIITIEGTEGKPYQENTAETVINSEKGSGEMFVDPGAKLTNNGCLMVYGKFYNLGTLVNNGRYDNKIISNDPDKGQYAYPRGIIVSWKDDVTQKNVVPGTLYNGIDSNGTVYPNALLINNGDIVLAPGSFENYATVRNGFGANIYGAAADKALIPIEPPTPTSTVTTKWVTIDPPKASTLKNSGTIYNGGRISPAYVEIMDNGAFANRLSVPGKYPDLFSIQNSGKIIRIYPEETPAKVPLASVRLEDGTWIYFYNDWTFLMVFTDGGSLTGSYTFYQNMLAFILNDGTVIEPPKGTATEGDPSYSFPESSGRAYEFTLRERFVSDLYSKVKT